MYAGMLLGAILLAGCSLKQEQIQEDRTSEPPIEVETLPDTVKEEVMPVVPLELTQEQKEEYYKQYEEIVRKVNSEYNQDLELGLLEDFKPEEWVTPAGFEHIVTDMATMEFTSEIFGGDPVNTE